MRLIDADALLDRLKFKRIGSIQRKTYSGLESAIAQVNKAPTIDAVEVVHGCWIKKTADCVYYYACSECGEPVLRSQWGCDFFSEYCPNCGAKMDGERKTE